MDSIDDQIDGMFDFDAFDDNGQDVKLVADQHLFENGPDLFSRKPPDLVGEPTALLHSGVQMEKFAHGTSEENIGLPASDREFCDKNFDLFAGENFDTGLASLAPLDQPTPQFMAQRFDGGLGLTFDPILPVIPELPPLVVEPAMMFGYTQPRSQVVLATLEEQQQWQAFKSQQTQFFQQEPQTQQNQQTQAVQQWEDVENEPGFLFQSPFESPVNESTSLGSQDFQGLEVSQDPQQAADLPQQDILSDEQIRLLQGVESVENVQPSVEVSPTNTTFSRDGANSEISRRSRNSHIRGRSSSRTATTEQTLQKSPQSQLQLADLTFASLEDAAAAMPSRYIENAWEPPSPDHTIPKTQRKRARYVLAMFEAFQDTSECKDNKNGHSHVKRWKDGGYYNLQSMEKVCWHLLDIAERMHADGPSSTIMYCEEALKKLKSSRTLTFEQRIHAICAMLKFSKYLCDQLMKGEGLEALVGAPKHKMSGATTMQVQNKKRQKWIVHGRTEDPIHPGPGPDENEGGEQEAVDDIQPVQRKTKPKVKRAIPAKSRAISKTHATKISRDDSGDDEESAYRRQSHTHIVRADTESDTKSDTESDTEMVDGARQVFTPEPLSSSASSSSRRKHIRAPRSVVNAGRTLLEKQKQSGKWCKERNTRLPTYRADLSEPDSEDEEPIHRAKRQQKRQKRSTEWIARNDGSNAGDLREAGYHNDSVQHSDMADLHNDEDSSNDGEDKDENDGIEENESEESDVASPPPFPSSNRKRKTGNTATEGRIQKIQRPISTVNRAAKPVPEPNKRKAQEEPESEDISKSEEDLNPPAKRTKSNCGSTRKVVTPRTTIHSNSIVSKKSETGSLRDAEGKFIRQSATPEPDSESKSESESESESELAPAVVVIGSSARITRRTAADAVKYRNVEKAKALRGKAKALRGNSQYSHR